MFAPFTITKDTIKELIKPIPEDAILRPNKKKIVEKELLKLLMGKDGVIDGAALQNLWFPVGNGTYDIFISHSHKDFQLALALASYLEAFCGLRSFVDGFVWQNVDDLLKSLDDQYTQRPDKLYDYTLRNYSTAHVYTMLSMSILEMIDRTECCIFIESDESIRVDGIRTQTPSSWLYEEVNFMKKIRIRLPKRYSNLTRARVCFSRGGKIVEETRQCTISYDVDLNDFFILTANDITTVLRSCNDTNLGRLDELYKRKNVFDKYGIICN